MSMWTILKTDSVSMCMHADMHVLCKAVKLDCSEGSVYSGFNVNTSLFTDFIHPCFLQVYCLGTLLSMQISFVGFQPVQSSEHMAVSQMADEMRVVYIMKHSCMEIFTV